MDFRLYYFGEIGRPGKIERFGVALAVATRDLALYRKVALQNVIFGGSSTFYRIGQAFPPVFEHASQRVLSALALGFGEGVNGATQPLLPRDSSTGLGGPREDTLALVFRAIRASCHSLSLVERQRVGARHRSLCARGRTALARPGF